jgi:predicted patatin/cPLA2 family phospholipase
MPTPKTDLHRAALAPGTLGGYLRELAAEPDNPSRPALVVQGGGLRGIYSLSALAVLERLGLRDAFSRVIGSSAGAINGAYFLAGQAEESLSIYTEDLSNRRFVNPWRLQKIVDVDYMIDVLREKHHLDEAAMAGAPATLFTVLTDAKTAEPRVVSSREGYDVYETFRATAALPGLYRTKVSLDPDDGHRYIDGGVSRLVPLDLALDREPGIELAGEESKPSEAVVLMTRARGHQKSEQSRLVHWVVHLLWLTQSRPVRNKVCHGDGRFNGVMERLKEEALKTPRETWTLFPTDRGRLVNRTTTDRDRLIACAEMAREDMLALLAEKHAALAYA